MKIGDRIFVYHIDNKFFPQRSNHFYDGEITGLNDKTKEIRFKENNDEYSVDNIGFVFRPRKFFIFDNYWSNEEYLEEKIRREEKEYKEKSKQQDIKKGWRFND